MRDPDCPAHGPFRGYAYGCICPLPFRPERDTLTASTKGETVGDELGAANYDRIWRLWKLGSLGLFAVFVGMSVDIARTLRRMSR